MLSYVLLTIWWVLIGGGLGEPEDEDEEKDSSTGVGGEGVCDGGGSGGGEELIVGPAGEEGTGTIEGNKDVEMGIGGEGVGVGGEREDRGDWKRKEDSSGDVNTTRGDMPTLITFMLSRVT